jgi:hypothetical protein
LGLQTQSDASRDVFPTRVTRGYYRTLGKARGWFLFFAFQGTYNNKQTFLHPQLTMVVVNHQQLTRLTKPKEIVRTKFFMKELKVK